MLVISLTNKHFPMRETQRPVGYDQTYKQALWRLTGQKVWYGTFESIWYLQHWHCVIMGYRGQLLWQIPFFSQCLKLCILDGSGADPINIQMEIWALHHSFPYLFIMPFLPHVPNLIFLFFFYKFVYGFVVLRFKKCKHRFRVYTPKFHWLHMTLQSQHLLFPPLESYYIKYSLTTYLQPKISKIPTEVIKMYLPHNSPGENLSNRSVCWVIHDSKHEDREGHEWMKRFKGKSLWDLIARHERVTESRSENDSGTGECWDLRQNVSSLVMDSTH